MLIPALIFLITLVSRLPFMSDKPYLMDSVGYCNGAMTTLVAHPPGYIGFCVLGRLAWYLTGDVNRGFVLVNIVATALAAVAVYYLGREMFGQRQGVIAALLYAASLDTWFNSEVALSYCVEGLLATLFVLLAWRAVTTKRLGWLFAATIVLAASGAVRHSTTAFLLPLWFYVTWVGTGKMAQRLANAVLLVAIVTGWLVTEGQIVSRVQGQDLSRSLYKMQGANKLDYNKAGLPGDNEEFKVATRFLWPGLEIAVAAWNKIQPPGAQAPAEVANATFAHGFAHLRTQGLKLVFYMILAGGLSSLVWILPLISRAVRDSFRASSGATLFLSLWILPAFAFFALGHFGPWGFLIIYLGALSIVSAQALVAFAASRTARESARRAICYGLAGLSAIASTAFFVFASPLPETSSRNNLLNILVFQYTAPAIKHHFARARSGWASNDR